MTLSKSTTQYPDCPNCDSDVFVESRPGLSSGHLVCQFCGTRWQEGADTTETVEDYLDWLSPIQRRDYNAVVIEGKSVADQARDRDVTDATVSNNIKRAKQRLRDVRDDEVGEHVE